MDSSSEPLDVQPETVDRNHVSLPDPQIVGDNSAKRRVSEMIEALQLVGLGEEPLSGEGMVSFSSAFADRRGHQRSV
jgi:hypothetical protein